MPTPLPVQPQNQIKKNQIQPPTQVEKHERRIVELENKTNLQARKIKDLEQVIDKIQKVCNWMFKSQKRMKSVASNVDVAQYKPSSKQLQTNGSDLTKR